MRRRHVTGSSRSEEEGFINNPRPQAEQSASLRTWAFVSPSTPRSDESSARYFLQRRGVMMLGAAEARIQTVGAPPNRSPLEAVPTPGTPKGGRGRTIWQKAPNRVSAP